MKYAIRVSAGDKVAGALNNTIKGAQGIHREAARFVEPLAAAEKRETTTRTVKPKRRRHAPGRTPAVVQQGTVVHGAFPKAAAGD